MPNPPEATRVFWHMNRVVALHKVRLHRQTAPLGVFAGQMPLLLFVKNNPGCTQRDIADALSVSTPSVATSIKRMQKAGLLEKLADASDMRCNKISLTARAEQVIRDGQRIFEEVSARMFEGVSPEELALLAGVLARMEDNLGGEEFRGKDFLAILNAAMPPSPPGDCVPRHGPGPAAGRAAPRASQTKTFTKEVERP